MFSSGISTDEIKAEELFQLLVKKIYHHLPGGVSYKVTPESQSTTSNRDEQRLGGEAILELKKVLDQYLLDFDSQENRVKDKLAMLAMQVQLAILSLSNCSKDDYYRNKYLPFLQNVQTKLYKLKMLNWENENQREIVTQVIESIKNDNHGKRNVSLLDYLRVAYDSVMATTSETSEVKYYDFSDATVEQYINLNTINSFAIVYLETQAHPYGHAVLQIEDEEGQLAYVHINNLYDKAQFLTPSQWVSFLDEWGYDIREIRKMPVPNVEAAREELLELRNKPWLWLGVKHNCLSFCNQVLVAGGATPQENISWLELALPINSLKLIFPVHSHSDYESLKHFEPYFEMILKKELIEDISFSDPEKKEYYVPHPYARAKLEGAFLEFQLQHLNPILDWQTELRVKRKLKPEVDSIQSFPADTDTSWADKSWNLSVSSVLTSAQTAEVEKQQPKKSDNLNNAKSISQSGLRQQDKHEKEKRASAKKLLENIKRKIEQTEWTLGWFGGENIAINEGMKLKLKRVPKHMQRIHQKIQAAMSSKQSKTVDFVNLLNRVAGICMLAENNTAFYDTRDKSTQQFYSAIAAFTLFDCQPEQGKEIKPEPQPQSQSEPLSQPQP